MTEPSACRHCGVPRREHFRRWTAEAGWHAHVAPTSEQIKARMLARRAARLTPEPRAAVTEDLFVTITVDTGPVVDAFRKAEASLMFEFHPDLRNPA